MLDERGQTFRYLYDAAHWRGRAEEMRVLAEVMRDPNARRMMIENALGYDRLAAWAEKEMLGNGMPSQATDPSDAF